MPGHQWRNESWLDLFPFPTQSLRTLPFIDLRIGQLLSSNFRRWCPLLLLLVQTRLIATTLIRYSRYSQGLCRRDSTVYIALESDNFILASFFFLYLPSVVKSSQINAESDFGILLLNFSFLMLLHKGSQLSEGAKFVSAVKNKETLPVGASLASLSKHRCWGPQYTRHMTWLSFPSTLLSLDDKKKHAIIRCCIRRTAFSSKRKEHQVTTTTKFLFQETPMMIQQCSCAQLYQDWAIPED